MTESERLALLNDEEKREGGRKVRKLI